MLFLGLVSVVDSDLNQIKIDINQGAPAGCAAAQVAAAQVAAAHQQVLALTRSGYRDKVLPA